MDTNIVGCSGYEHHTQSPDITASDSRVKILPQTQMLSDAEELLEKFSVDYQKMAE